MIESGEKLGLRIYEGNFIKHLCVDLYCVFEVLIIVKSILLMLFFVMN